MNKAYAESVADVGRLRLRRRDVNAMRLALDMCRANRGLFACLAALSYGGPVSERIRGAGNDAWGWYFTDGRGPVPGDVVRARLALLLRVLLRVNDGTGTLVSGCRKQRRGMPCTCWDGRVRPLWEAR